MNTGLIAIGAGLGAGLVTIGAAMGIGKITAAAADDIEVSDQSSLVRFCNILLFFSPIELPGLLLLFFSCCSLA